MAKDSSFDVVSEYDVAEVTNAVDQAQREIASRYDFKGTAAAIEFMSKDKEGVTLEVETDYQLKALIDVLQGKLIKRGLSPKLLDLSTQPFAGGKTIKQTVRFKKGLDQEQAKKIAKLIRDGFPKVKTQVQGEAVRVTSGSRDELQAVIAMLKQQDLDYPLQFNNYR